MANTDLEFAVDESALQHCKLAEVWQLPPGPRPHVRREAIAMDLQSQQRQPCDQRARHLVTPIRSITAGIKLTVLPSEWRAPGLFMTREIHTPKGPGCLGAAA
jgi:hypothetical protein